MFRVLIVCAIVVSAANCAKILGAFISPSYSHQLFYQPIWKELSLRGHQVTVITTDPLNDPNLTNLTEIDISYAYDIWKQNNYESTGIEGKLSSSEQVKRLTKTHFQINDAVLGDHKVQAIINDTTREFDLFLVEFIYSSMFGLKDRFNCPLIGLSSFGLTANGYDAIGNPNNPGLNPDFLLPFSTSLTFWQRLHSSIYNLLYKIIVKFQITPILNEIQKKHIGDYVRPIDTIAADTSLLIVNSNLALHSVKPIVPAFVEISGIHIKPPKPLPDDLKTYLDNATEGVIYFSLGTNVNSSSLPQSKLNMLLETFADLPYKVLWKFENNRMANKRDNVEIRKWLPQQDVLGHHNVKLFITQGGQQSLEEAIHNRVPTLIMPFFGDQPRNAQHLTSAGAALSINFHTTNKEELKSKIMELMTNPQYKKTVNNLSKIVQDQQIPALDKAVWWIEYVLRHDGAPHLRYKGADTPFHQYFLLDVIAFIVAAISVSLYVISKFVLVCYRLCNRLSFINIYTTKSHEE